MFLYILSDFQNAIIRPNRFENRAKFEAFSLPLIRLLSLATFYETNIFSTAQLTFKINKIYMAHEFVKLKITRYIPVNGFRSD